LTSSSVTRLRDVGSRAPLARDAWITSRNLGLRLTIRDAGSGAPVVVFVHSIGMYGGSFGGAIGGVDFLGALCDEGLTVVALDLQGHGMSEGRRGHVPFLSAMQNISETVGFVAERFGGSIGIAGSGLGAFLALYAALEDERIAAAACHTIADLRSIDAFEPRMRGRVVASLAGRVRRLDAVAPFIRVPLRALYSPAYVFEDDKNLAHWRADKRSVWSYSFDTLASIFLSPDEKPALEALDKPVYVITGDSDRVVPLAGQEEAVARLGNAELFVLGGAGHMLPLEHCGQTAPRMAEFLRKVL
jgi:pimeloyl-ACP methyl ester carboxylesterase